MTVTPRDACPGTSNQRPGTERDTWTCSRGGTWPEHLWPELCSPNNADLGRNGGQAGVQVCGPRAAHRDPDNTDLPTGQVRELSPGDPRQPLPAPWTPETPPTGPDIRPGPRRLSRPPPPRPAGSPPHTGPSLHTDPPGPCGSLCSSHVCCVHLTSLSHVTPHTVQESLGRQRQDPKQEMPGDNSKETEDAGAAARAWETGASGRDGRGLRPRARTGAPFTGKPVGEQGHAFSDENCALGNGNEQKGRKRS